MTTRQKDLTEGAIQPIYTDHVNKKGFRGMARLIRQEDPPVFDPNSAFYIKEYDSRLPSNYRQGGFIGINHGGVKQKCEILKVGVNQLIVLKGDKEMRIEKPYDNVIDMFEIGDFLRIEADNYKKTWVVVDDNFKSTSLLTYKAFMQKKEYIASTSIAEVCKALPSKILRKPFQYQRDTQEPMSIVYKSERWLLDFLPNPFLSSLKEGDIVYYKDLGEYNVLKIERGVCIVYPRISDRPTIDDFKPVTAKAEELYVDNGKSTLRTHGWLSYYYVRSNKFHADPFDVKEDDSDVEDKPDFWEMSNED